jgi:hypothetical protein
MGSSVKRGERALVGVIGLLVVAGVVRAVVHKPAEHDGEIPFYSSAPPEVASRASDLVRRYACRDCHSLWTTRDPMRAVPAPILDGIGSLRSLEWLTAYLSSRDPQAMLPSRMKAEYRMPSYADMPDADRRILAQYLSSLQVKDWYLDQTRRLEHDRLTGDDTAEK